MGISAYPSISLIYSFWVQSEGLSLALRLFLLSIVLCAAYFVFGILIIFVASFFRVVLRLNLEEGEHKIGSPAFLKWMLYSALIIGVRAIFMEFMALTPLIRLFYRLMGSKVGQNVQINSQQVGDYSLLEIGDGTVIGGHATVIGHSFEPRGLRLQKVKIGKNVLIGLNAIVLPGCEIGDNAVIAAGAILPKGTKVLANTTYFGVKSSINEKQ